MELKEIQSLIKLVSSSGVDEVALEKKDFKIRIRKNAPAVVQAHSAPQPVAAAPVAPSAPAPAPSSPAPATSDSPKAEAPAASGNLIEIKSPMIGTFYRKSAPDKPNFVEVGDTIEKGKVLCIIEAMKLFNEIESEVSGKIVKVLVDDSEPVEYDQPLFLVEPA
ncbi:acetyl-CoA carboxylase biotin carboxyl carrier protein [bacterium]|nr:acetyl-CoA carboxylase biotin carboxyl carrier protein [bacterium]